MEHGSRSVAPEHADFYLRSREVSSIAIFRFKQEVPSLRLFEFRVSSFELLSFESSAARVSLEGRLEEAELARSGIEEANMARASLEARLVEADEAKVELVARLGVSEESKSSSCGSSSSCLEGDIIDCMGVIDYIVSSSGSSIMKGDVVDYIDVVNYSDYIVYGSKQGAFELQWRQVLGWSALSLMGVFLSRRALSRLFLEEDLRSPQLFQVIATVCH